MNQRKTHHLLISVLVNDQQKQDLKKAEGGGDRFNREVEDQQLPQPSTLGNILAVPEPAEWMLMGGWFIAVKSSKPQRCK